MKSLLSFKRLLLVSSLSFSLMLGGCASVGKSAEPSDAEINAEAAKAYAEVKSKAKFSQNADWNALVQRVAKRIELASGENFQWEAVLIESSEVNAWCMPGGKIAVYTGIMPVLKNEAALAAVLGHEVAHATLRHGKKQYARAMQENLVGVGVGLLAIGAGQFLCKSESCKLITGLGGAAAGLAITFFDRKYSRGDESEADQTGQIYMAKAGYDPSEAIHLWERMGAASGGNAPPEWLSTHPSDSNRKQNLTAWLPNTNNFYQQSPQKFGLGEAIH